jgi:hypothetical protein
MLKGPSQRDKDRNDTLSKISHRRKLEEIEETELWKDRQTEKLGCQDILGRR